MNGYTTPQKVQQRDAYRMCSNCNFNKSPLNTRVFRFQMNHQEVGYGLLLLGAVFLLEYLTDLWVINLSPLSSLFNYSFY